MSKRINVVLLVLVTALLVGGAVYWLKPSTTVDVSVTVEQMRNIARLATTEWTMSAFAEKDFYHADVSDLIHPGRRRKQVQSDYVIARCSGKVTGSVDMEKAQIDSEESGERRHVSIHFPRGSVVVSDAAIDPKTLEIISARDKISKALLVYKGATAAEQEEVQREAISKIKQTAIELGIVQKTKENATMVLTEFVGSLGYEATITFEDDAYEPQSAETLAALPAAGGK